MTSFSEEKIDSLLEEESKEDDNRDSVNEVEEINGTQSQEWEKMAMAWVSAFQEARSVERPEVATWIDSNLASLPADLQSMPRSDLIDRLISIQGYLRPPESPQDLESIDTVGGEDDEAIQGDVNEFVESNGWKHFNQARFQRTDCWIPMYSWLESLDTSEVVKSKDISEWLNQNPIVGNRLSSRHSKYHLFHYIKKCHMKILKRREKKKTSGLLPIDNLFDSPVFAKSEDANEMTTNQNGETYLMKRAEALARYRLLLALERKLSPLYTKILD